MIGVLKYFAFSLLLSAVFYAGRRSVDWQPQGIDLTALPKIKNPVGDDPSPTPRQVARAHEDCSDTCEQHGIVAGVSELHVKACKARCDADHPLTAAAPREAPRSITVAPADHGR